jgi:hypothetical protein
MSLARRARGLDNGAAIISLLVTAIVYDLTF